MEQWGQKLDVREWEENETASIKTVTESCCKGEKQGSGLKGDVESHLLGEGLYLPGTEPVENN